MPKSKSVFFCRECGYESAKWLGRCPGCGQWNTFVEERVVEEPKSPKNRPPIVHSGGAQPIAEVALDEEVRLTTGLGELDRVLGGGIVPGSLVLVGGDPGIGKSTLLLQAANAVCNRYGPVLYVSGEESTRQVRMRAERLGTLNSSLYVACETDLDTIRDQAEQLKPHLLIIDSIQTMHLPELASAPGSVSQVREGTAFLTQLAKGWGLPVMIVGHVTKEGAIAGPRVVEHMVDTVLYFEGDRYDEYRVLRAVKNRFGSTNEIGIFKMEERGLSEVASPSEVFLAERASGSPGSVVVASVEGTRSVLVELQALVSPSGFGYPRRVVEGIDNNRVALVIAVLERRVGLQLGNQDAYLKVTGGISVEEPAADLGVAIAIASSFRGAPVDPGLCAVGEVGLAGEVRGVARLEQRIREAARMGFRTCLVPASGAPTLTAEAGISTIGVRTVAEAIDVALGG